MEAYLSCWSIPKNKIVELEGEADFWTYINRLLRGFEEYHKEAPADEKNQ